MPINILHACVRAKCKYTEYVDIVISACLHSHDNESWKDSSYMIFIYDFTTKIEVPYEVALFLKSSYVSYDLSKECFSM